MGGAVGLVEQMMGLFYNSKVEQMMMVGFLVNEVLHEECRVVVVGASVSAKRMDERLTVFTDPLSLSLSHARFLPCVKLSFAGRKFSHIIQIIDSTIARENLVCGKEV